jgi:single-strand DNA-binding protein
MANLNKVMLIGRLTRDPESRTFSTGGKVAKFGFAVNNRRKNPSTGQWEDEPVYLDIDAFNRGEFGKNADLVEQYLRKGTQVFIEGHLVLDQWTDKDGQKRSKLKIVLDNMQFLERREDGGSGEGSRYQRSGPAPQRQTGPPMDGGGYEDAEPPIRAGAAGGEEDIPF